MNEKVNRLLFGTRQAKQALATNSDVLVPTSSISVNYLVVDSIVALSSQKSGWNGVDLDSIFESVKNKLRDKCIELGGHAVINCQFSERSAHSGGLAPAQVIEMWAYGTVVKVIGDDARN